MRDRACHAIVKSMGQDRSPIQRKSVGFPLSDVSCPPNDLVPSLGLCPRSPLASDWMLSCFHSSRFLSRPPPRSIRPPVSCVWSSPASTRFPPLPGCTRRLSSIPVSHRSWSILGPIPLSCAIPPLGFTSVVAVRCAHTIRICVLRSHISSTPNTFFPPSPLPSKPFHTAWPCPGSSTLFPSYLPCPPPVGCLSFR